MAGPTPDFWQDRFEKGQALWDRGGVSPQLRTWLDTGSLAPSTICVPGCGSGWEVAELARRGFDVTGVDHTPAAIERTRALLQRQELVARVEQADVLTWYPEQPFDAIYEQTCLCALHPDHWMPTPSNCTYGSGLRVRSGRCSCRPRPRARPKAA